MSTTIHLRKKPEYYNSIEECSSNERKRVNTNYRYKNFNQLYFTAGDVEQFYLYRDYTNSICEKNVNLSDNIFEGYNLNIWEKNKNLNSLSVDNTFKYMFNKLKKGIFVKIHDNKLKVFLPFSKKSFVNEWSDNINIDPKFGNMYNFVKYINGLMNKNYKIRISKYKENWYANNCLLRYEYPMNEGDTNVANMFSILKLLCESRDVPNIEFFINRRDFPVIRKDEMEAYDDMFGDVKLLSHNYNKYSPILSMVTTDKNGDIPIPTGDDIARVFSYESKYFQKSCKNFPSVDTFKKVKWKDKIKTAVFRGASTGCGVTIETNMRLKVSYLSVITKSDNDIPLLDAGITKWQLRPRKLKNQKYLKTIDVKELSKKGIDLVKFMSPLDQSKHKYIIHIDGHVSAFRLSLELSMGSCLLLVNSKYELWFRKLLKPMIHYIPIKEDLSDLVEKIKWCRLNDKKCKKIAKNAVKFYKKYLQKDGILDYLQNTLVEIKRKTGNYFYNIITPLEQQLGYESKSDIIIHKTDISNKYFNEIPLQSRSYGLLKGIQMAIDTVINRGDIKKLFRVGDNIFRNKIVTINKYTISKFNFIVKNTSDNEKNKENIHESFICKNVINELVKYVPNFSYYFGKYDNNLVMEHINGLTFEKWIKSDKFNMADYLFILIQIALSLQFAQQYCGFVHYDLTPWNIVIQEVKIPVTFDYILGHNKVYQIKTKYIPVIIDYGKSHVIYKNIHYGFINMYKISTIQDILSILITSLNLIVNNEYSLRKCDKKDIINLLNFISNTKYRNEPFKNINDVKKFIELSRNYNELTNRNKHELENLNPLDFINYIESQFKRKFKNKMSYKIVDECTLRLNKGHSKQVYNYIFSSNINEKTQSYGSVLENFLNCQLEELDNPFFRYYTVQNLYNFIESIWEVFNRFLINNNIDINNYKKIYNKCVLKLDKYNEQTKKMENKDVKYKVKNIDFIDNYSDSILSNPYEVLDILEKNKTIKDSDIDIIDYLIIVQEVLTNKQRFKLSTIVKEYYIDNFKELLQVYSINIRKNMADICTTKFMSKTLYKQNIDFLNSVKCDNKINSNVLKYKVLYEKIFKIIK